MSKFLRISKDRYYYINVNDYFNFEYVIKVSEIFY